MTDVAWTGCHSSPTYSQYGYKYIFFYNNRFEMVLTGGIMAGVLYARRMSGAPNSRLKKYYEKCRNRNHKLPCLTFYDWQLSHLPLLAAFVFLQFLIITVAMQQPSQMNEQEHERHIRQLRYQNMPAIQSPLARVLPSNILLLTIIILTLLNIWMLCLTKLIITNIDRTNITRKQWKIYGKNVRKTPLNIFTQLIIEEKGKDRFTESSKHYELTLLDKKERKMRVSSSISKIVIKRHYIEYKTFMGHEVDVDGIESVVRRQVVKET